MTDQHSVLTPEAKIASEHMPDIDPERTLFLLAGRRDDDTWERATKEILDKAIEVIRTQATRIEQLQRDLHEIREAQAEA